MGDWRDISNDQNLRLAQKMLEQQGEINRLRAEREQLYQHSVALNTVAWKAAVALGEVREGTTQVDGDPVVLIDRLIAEYEHLRAQGSSVEHR